MKMRLFKANFTNSLDQDLNFLKGFRKWKLAVLMGFVILLFAQPVYGDSPAPSTFGSSSTISVTNNSTTTDFEGPLPIDMNPKNLIDGSFVNSTAGDILFTDQNSVEVGGIGTNISSNAVPFFWYTEVDKGTSKQLKLYTFNANPATHKFPLGGTLNDDITVADSASLDIADHLTLEATIELKEDPTGTQEIFFKQGEYRLYLDNGVLKADLESSTTEEIWSTQNLLPAPSPTYNHSNPQNNQGSGMVTQWAGYGSYNCETKWRTNSGWDTNNPAWDQAFMDNSYYWYGAFDYNAKYLYALDKELMGVLDGHYGIASMPRKGPWADVVNGIDVEGVYNHEGYTVNQYNLYNNSSPFGAEMIHLKDDPNGYYTDDNFTGHTIVYWNDIGRADWNNFSNHPWGYLTLQDMNPWNDSDQQSQEWYDRHYPAYWTNNNGIQANMNTPFSGGGSYLNAIMHSSLHSGWEQNLAVADITDMNSYANNPLYDNNQLGSYTDTLFQSATNPFDPVNTTTHNAKDAWMAPNRAFILPNYQGGNQWTCYVGYRHADFDETGLQNIKILGVKNHLLYQTDNYSGSSTSYDQFEIHYGADPETTPSMFNNLGSFGSTKTGSRTLTGGGGFGGHYAGTIWHYGSPRSWQGAFAQFTHPTTDQSHPKYGQTMNTPSSYGFQDMYDYVGPQTTNTTVEDVNHWWTTLRWGSYNTRIYVLAHWLQVNYFAEQMVASTANVVSTGNPLVKDQNYDIKLTFDKPDVKLYVDGVEVGSSTLSGDITNTSNSIVIGESIAGWVDDIKIGSTDITNPTYALQLAFEPSHNTNTQIGDISNSWTYAGSIADQSGNGNNAIYNLVADTTDITTTVGGLQVTDDVPAGTGTETVANMVGAVPIATFLTPTSTFLESQIASGAVSAVCEIDPATGLQVDPNCVQGEHSPFLAGLFLADQNSGMPQGVWWLLLATLVATIIGSKVMKFIPSLTIVAIVGGVVLGFITLIAGLSYWFLLFYTLWAMGSISIHQYWKA